MQTIRTIGEMQRFADGERRAGRTIGFVPTMGALHAGHRRTFARCEMRRSQVIVRRNRGDLLFGNA